MSTTESQTLEEKCTTLINDLARYGKRGEKRIVDRFAAAKRASDSSGNPIGIVQNMARDIYDWANALEKGNDKLSRNLHFREEWNTLVKAIVVLELLYEDKAVKKPKMFGDFKKRVDIQHAAQERTNARYRETFASIGGYDD